jgi:hypothetical protein
MTTPRKVVVVLTEVEVAHLVDLLVDEAERGDYTGNPVHYWKRNLRILEKLRGAWPQQETP